MTAIRFPDLVDDRADVLAAHGVNGIRLVLVSLPPGPSPDHADLDLRFYNGLHLPDIVAEITGDPARAGQIFRVRGGTRILAGPSAGQVKVTTVSAVDATRLSLRVEPVGDYSTYTLELVFDASRIDPFFSEIGFKFRPGCFTNDCAPVLEGRPRPPGPAIDYLAKDYDSFRHALMVAMAARVPGWQSTSEADHDQVLIDLLAAAADELSDYQDRVMNEAYLATLRGRVALARHARLVDYHVHQGNQSSTQLAVEVLDGQTPFTLDQELVVWTGPDEPLPESRVFATRQRRLDATARVRFDPLVNRLRLHTWRNAQPALRAGSTTADVVPAVAGAAQAEADALRDLVRTGALTHLLIAELLNPLTGRVPGRNPRKRQLLQLEHGDGAAETFHDPVTNTFLVRLRWREEDRLRFDYSFTTFCSGTPVEDVSLFFGNLVPVHEGLPMAVHFHEAATDLPPDADEVKHRFYQRLDRFGNGRDWVLCTLPENPLAYLPTPANGEVPPRTTLHVEVEQPNGGTDVWDEVESLVHSDDSAEQGDHFMVETDERRRSVLRFGNGTNGQLLPHGAVVHADYQIGGGHEGNIGADQLMRFRDLTGALTGAIVSVWNPFDVTDGRDPETFASVRRNAPEAYRARQLRAVTLADYVRRAEEVPGVARAVARYAWTGSWRTVRIVLDPVGTIELKEPLRADVAAHLESVRLIGEDLELRPPRFAPLAVRITVCADDAYWREDVRFVLEQEFSDGYTSDGRRGFFHPDEWTFGQSLHRSEIEGRVHRVAGIKHIISIEMRRLNVAVPPVASPEVIEMGFDEVVLAANDPDHFERGFVRFTVLGGTAVMACNPLITDPFEFPRRTDNRPALPRIRYRIGEYPDFVESMTRAIDQALPLASWTHREPDDPAIALLQGAAILGDILTFYQEHYANEAYLRTSAWRESVADLVRLTGYRLAPGIGGHGTFAFEVRGTTPVTIRQGFPLKADLADVPTAADFQTESELTAWPHLGRFQLLNQRNYAAFIPGHQATFEIASAGGATDALALEALDLKEDDRLLLLPEENLLALLIQFLLGWTLDQPSEEIVVVKSVERVFGRVIVTLAGNFTHGWLTNCRAFLLGRTFRHFGANAPPDFVTTNTAVTPPITSVNPTFFIRDLRGLNAPGAGYSPIQGRVFPLDQDVSDLASGAQAIVTGIVTNTVSYVLPFAVSRQITALSGSVPRWGNLSAASTLVRLSDVLAPAWTTGLAAFGDLRNLHLHETKGPLMTLRPVATFSAGPFANSGTNALRFFGTSTQAQALAGRRLFLSHTDGRSQEMVCTNETKDFDSQTPDVPALWPISFDRSPAPFVREDFNEVKPAVTVFGNLVDASQGKQERDAVLGNGDSRQLFQTFPLPKPDLTYFLASDGFPPHAPELDIFVNGRLWSRVEAFFGHGPKEEIYVVREDADGLSHVQFGDGETGARLPSGLGNVAARYRTGNGARGAIKPGATPSASERPPGFDKVSLAGIVSGGADPEPADKAREAAPGKVQSLGRLVSILDYETETLAIPGVTTAVATWDLDNGVPSVQLRVLLDAGREAEFEAVRRTIAHAQRCHGPDRFPVRVERASLRYAFLDVVYARDPRLRADAVDAAIRAALGLAGDSEHERTGLFGRRARRLGDVEYASRIEGRIQNAAGVLWCRVTGFDLFDPPVPPAVAVDPAILVLAPAPRALVPIAPCAANELLQLAPQHLTLLSVDEPSAGECA